MKLCLMALISLTCIAANASECLVYHVSRSNFISQVARDFEDVDSKLWEILNKNKQAQAFSEQSEVESVSVDVYRNVKVVLDNGKSKASIEFVMKQKCEELGVTYLDKPALKFTGI